MTASIEYINTQPWSNLFQVSPSQFNVTCQLQKEKFLQLSIINSCNDFIAWKLKTNRPGRYMVSPKQGIIEPKQHKDCTVVLSKLKEIPNTKKPDKFLIQATKINGQIQDSDLPQLWKDRESKHDKKRGVYAFQSLTIKCFLNINIKPSISEEKKQNEKPNIIEDYVSSESATKDIDNQTAISSINTDKYNNMLNKSDNIVTTEEATTVEATTVEANIESCYNAQKIEEWRSKALEYDELFQFTQKTLAQRDELNRRWKTEQEKTRHYMKLNRELKEEKKHILNEYNKYRNINEIDNKYGNINDDYDYNDKIKREKEKNEVIQEMNEIEQNAIRNSKSRFTISIIHIIITILLMYFAFIAGKYNIFGFKQTENALIDNNTVHNTLKDKNEM